MLQIILAILLLLTPEAYAQVGVVTSTQRAGGVPQRVLDKLKALEDKATLVSGLFTYIDNRDGITGTACTAAATVPMVTSLSPVTEACTTLPKNRDGLLVSFTNRNAFISMLPAGTTALAKLQAELNNQNCATATGWRPCTTDNLRQAFTLRNSTAASTGFGGSSNIRLLGLDGGQILRLNAATAVTSNMCSGYTSSGALRGEVIYQATDEGTAGGLGVMLCSVAGNGALAACCRIP